MSEKATPLSPQEVIEIFRNAALVWNAIAEQSATIAHARRVLYEAYLSEGFTEAQALELCKILTI